MIRAMVENESHPCLEMREGLIRFRMGRLPTTKRALLPLRTAEGRQQRLKSALAQLMAGHNDFEMVPEKETTGSLVFRCRAIL